MREASECAQSSSTTSFQDQVQAATRVCAPTLAIACHRLPSLASASAARTVPPDPDCAHTACAFVTAMGSIPFLKQLEPGIRPCLTVCPQHIQPCRLHLLKKMSAKLGAMMHRMP